MPKVVTANTLATGRVVFLADGDVWVETIDRARLFGDAEAADAGLAQANGDAERAVIVDPFVADVSEEREGRWKMTLRDTIRAYGPTITYHRDRDAPAERA